MTPEEQVLGHVIEVLDRLDLIIRKARPFSVEEFSRDSGSTSQSAAALRWSHPRMRFSPSSNGHGGVATRNAIRDAAGVLELNPAIEKRYVAFWAEQLGVRDLWDQMARSAS